MSYLNDKPFANQYWFPIAALHAALILPLTVAGQMQWLSLPAGLQTPANHGHEMIFGFAMAVVAGYILGPQTRQFAFSIIGVWLLARLSYWFAPQHIVSTVFNLGFFALLLWKVIPVFLRAAKRWSNRTVGIVVMSLAAILTVIHGLNGLNLPYYALNRSLLFEAILLLSALMFFMGGRMIGPAVGIYLQQEKNIVVDRIQQRLEALGLLSLLATALSNAVLTAWIPGVTAVLMIVSASIALLRLYRWQVWSCYARADILALIVGYSWLPIAWLLIAYSLLWQQYPLSYAYHAISVGALGTLTFTVMARGRMHKELKSPNALPWIFGLVILINLAAILRLSLLQLDVQLALLAAAAFWSLAFMGLFLLMLGLLIKRT